MTAPQLEYYAAARAGTTAIIHRDSERIVAWVEHDGQLLRARRGAWRSDPVETIPTLIALVAQHVRGERDWAAPEPR